MSNISICIYSSIINVDLMACSPLMPRGNFILWYGIQTWHLPWQKMQRLPLSVTPSNSKLFVEISPVIDGCCLTVFLSVSWRSLCQFWSDSPNALLQKRRNRGKSSDLKTFFIQLCILCLVWLIGSITSRSLFHLIIGSSIITKTCISWILDVSQVH